MKYIIGKNNVSYFLAYILEDTKLILHKTLEELDYNSGPMIIPVSLLSTVKKEFKNISILEFERFYDDRGKYTSVMPKNFPKLYSLYTRGKTVVEESYSKNFSKYTKFVSIDGLGPEHSYDKFFKKIKEIVNERVINKPIVSINLDGSISFGEDSINFEKLISTINMIDLVELDKTGKIRDSIVENNNLEGFKLPYNDKFVYTCNLESEEDNTLSNLYKQILVTGKPYFRKTYVGDKIIYETMRNIYDKDIEGNKILDYVESTQISDNLNITKIMGIDLVGKFSEWNENTTLETIYIRAHELKEFYSNAKNNHKKVL